MFLPIGLVRSNGQKARNDSQPALLGDSFNLEFSTFLGGINQDEGFGNAVANDGSCYVIGDTESSNFPTRNAYNGTYGGSKDIFVMKFYDESIKVPVFGFIAIIIIMLIILLLKRRRRN